MFMPRFCYLMVLLVVVLFFAWFSCVPTPRRSNPEASPRPTLPASSMNKFSPIVYDQQRSGLSSCFDQTTSQLTIKPLEMIMQTPWAQKLQKILANMTFSGSLVDLQQPHRQVTVVFGDAQQYESSLLVINWLVSALVMTNPPLKNIVVISLDEELQALLDNKDIASVHVNPETVTCGQIKRKLSLGWITRCAVYMLLNHWGYDVMGYDTDAIVLKNLQDILETFGESDIIGSAGDYPPSLVAEWGQTLCMGVVLFRSTRKTERLWNALRQGEGGNLQIFDDQVAINNILFKCDIKWSNANSSSQLQVMSGQCTESEDNLSGLKVTILPTSVICRKCHRKHKSGYVWHKRAKKTVAAKMRIAAITGTWYLKEITETSMMTENEELKGIDWIRALAEL